MIKFSLECNLLAPHDIKDITLKQKYQTLRSYIAEEGPSVVAFSGGLDSTFLAFVASTTCPPSQGSGFGLRRAQSSHRRALGSNVIAVTAQSELLASWEIEEARKMAHYLKVKHVILPLRPLQSSLFTANTPQRCYHCKQALILKLKELGQKHNTHTILFGSNADDVVSPHRPGEKALQEEGIKVPLAKAGLTKKEIRLLSQKFNLPTWNKPSGSCLATRIPYKQKITPPKLKAVEEAESLLKKWVRCQVRVRLDNWKACIEVEEPDIKTVINRQKQVAKELKRIGFRSVFIDLEGYRAGSLNLPIQKRKKCLKIS